MPQAYILLTIEDGVEDNVLRQIKNIESVEQSHVSYGVYDLIIKIKADTIQELGYVVTHRIRQIKQVQSTLTLLLIDKQGSRANAL